MLDQETMSNREIIDSAIAQLTRVNSPEDAQGFISKINSLDEAQAVAYIGTICPLWFVPSGQELGKRAY